MKNIETISNTKSLQGIVFACKINFPQVKRYFTSSIENSVSKFQKYLGLRILGD